MNKNKIDLAKKQGNEFIELIYNQVEECKEENFSFQELIVHLSFMFAKLIAIAEVNLEDALADSENKEIFSKEFFTAITDIYYDILSETNKIKKNIQ